MGRLYAELIEREQNHSLTRPFPKWDEVSELPYLDACINEAVRLHPPFCLPFERVVPPGGITIGTESVYLPEGTVVGMNPYVANRHKPTFGEDADEWNPDRWLGRDERQRKKMEQSVLTVSSFPSVILMVISTRQNILTVSNQFGAGRRVCLGKHVAMLEMKKLVPALLLNYEVSLVLRSYF
jgi:cytochrome P450